MAAAAIKPGVSTLGAAKVTITTATLTGKINPHGAPTTFYFQYGTTTAYGSRTPTAGVGSGNVAVGATADIAGSGPTRSTTTASSRTTAPAPRSVATGRSPRPSSRSGSRSPPRPTPCPSALPRRSRARCRAPATRGVRSSSAEAVPFTTAFANLGNPQLTNAQGGFAFALLSVPLTTQYRVLITDKPSVVSPVLTVNVSVVVGTRTTRTHVHRGANVHFSGTVHPGVANLPIAIQKLNAKHHWVTISGSITRTGGVYGKSVRIRRGGSYRVYAGASGGTLPRARGARSASTRSRPAPPQRPRAGSA
jgi:hypothetical protein